MAFSPKIRRKTSLEIKDYWYSTTSVNIPSPWNKTKENSKIQKWQNKILVNGP